MLKKKAKAVVSSTEISGALEDQVDEVRGTFVSP